MKTENEIRKEMKETWRAIVLNQKKIDSGLLTPENLTWHIENVKRLENVHATFNWILNG
jgi:hypothetical protein